MSLKFEVDALMAKLAMHDASTHGHVISVASFSRRLATTMVMPPSNVAFVERCGALHDIGKLFVSPDILNKPGPLDDGEWDVMRCHPELGARLLADIPLLRDCAPIIMAHHERVDGRGYPLGLMGTRIPLEARMVSVCDAFHVMIGGRPYREAISPQAAIRELVRCSGTQFDAWVVDTFVSALEAGLSDDVDIRREGWSR